METNDIKTASPFNELFSIDETVLNAIIANMEEKGFDYGSPIIIWAGKDIVIDGHTRLEAAKRVGLEEIPIYQVRFGNESEALAYAIHNQRNRRNLTEAELLRCIEAVDKVKDRGEGQERVGGKFQPKSSSEPIGESADHTAKIVGTSASKVKKARKVKKENPEAHEEVKAGKKTINKAYQETVAKGKPPRPAEPIATEEDKRQTTILALWEEIMAWRKTASQYPELKEIVWAIDAAVEKRKSK